MTILLGINRLVLWRIGHRYRRSIDQLDSPSSPVLGVRRVLYDHSSRLSRHAANHFQRQILSGFAIGARPSTTRFQTIEGTTDHVGIDCILAGSIAAQRLSHEQ